MSFQEIPNQDLCINPMEMISRDWWLVTARNEKYRYNTMTASGGAFRQHMGASRQNGTSRSVLIVYVRLQRFTKEFIDCEDIFNLSVFADSYKRELVYLGQHSRHISDAKKKAMPQSQETVSAYEKEKHNHWLPL